MNRKQKKMLLRIVCAAAGLIVLSLLPLTGLPKLALYLALYILIGGDILRKALRGLLNRQLLDENFLMAVATLGAFALALFTRSGDYNEAIAVMLFYQTGELFQSMAVGRSRKNIAALMDIRPDSANLEKNGALTQADPSEVPIGSTIVVQPGEKIPLDGVVLSGTSSLDTAALTGESLPRTVKAGDAVVSGCVSMSGVLRIQTTKEFGESTVSKILELVENAASRKSRSEAFISRFARVYTPAVCAAALALAVLPPAVLLLTGGDPGWADWLYRALSFLVISCPCALVISIPLTFFAGIGGAGSAGILIKGSNYLEALSKVRCVVLDKTGTLTSGSFSVTDVSPVGIRRETLLDLVAHAECASSHPISRSLRAAWGAPVDRSRVTDIREVSGEGVLAKVDGKAVAVGSGKLMRRVGAAYQANTAPGTVIYAAVEGSFAGSIVISDTLKPTAKAAMDALHADGIRTVMLTGDAEAAARTVASQLGIGQYRAQLLPGDKVAEVERLLERKEKNTALAFVGDGINDAPVLSRADIGIAMGAMGSDAAIEAADVVLMDDDPAKLPKAIRTARKCMRIVRQNVVFSLGIKFLFLALTALGFSNMWLAIFADVGVMVLAVLNAIRALTPAK